MGKCIPKSIWELIRHEVDQENIVVLPLRTKTVRYDKTAAKQVQKLIKELEEETVGDFFVERFEKDVYHRKMPTLLETTRHFLRIFFQDPVDAVTLKLQEKN